MSGRNSASQSAERSVPPPSLPAPLRQRSTTRTVPTQPRGQHLGQSIDAAQRRRSDTALLKAPAKIDSKLSQRVPGGRSPPRPSAVSHRSPERTDPYPTPTSPELQAPSSPREGVSDRPVDPPAAVVIALPTGRQAIEAALIKKYGSVGICGALLPVAMDDQLDFLQLRMIGGSPIGVGKTSIQGFLHRSQNKQISFEKVDAFCLPAHLKYGSVIIEWAKVVCGGDEAGSGWDNLNEQACQKGLPKVCIGYHRRKRACLLVQIFAAYFESPEPRISNHYAIVLVTAESIDFETLKLDRGQWQSSDLGLIALLLSLPLDSKAPPVLTNPVDIRSEPVPVVYKQLSGPIDLLSSYAIDHKLLAFLSEQSVQYYPECRSEFLDSIRNLFETAGVLTNPEKPEILVIERVRLPYACLPMNGYGLSRDLAVLAVGPSLSLLPSQWKVQTMWNEDGLVTFSPSLLLRQSDAIANIVRVLASRPSANWATYVIPSVIEWIAGSLGQKE
jgi:hypothetical protein